MKVGCCPFNDFVFFFFLNKKHFSFSIVFVSIFSTKWPSNEAQLYGPELMALQQELSTRHHLDSLKLVQTGFLMWGRGIHTHGKGEKGSLAWSQGGG